MSSKKQPEANRIRKFAGSFKGRFSSLFHLSREPSPSSIEMDSSSDNPTRWVTKSFSPAFHGNSLVLLSIAPLDMVPVTGIDATTAVFSSEAHILSPGAPNSVPVLNQLGSSSGRGSETPTTVSDHFLLTIVC